MKSLIFKSVLDIFNSYNKHYELISDYTDLFAMGLYSGIIESLSLSSFYDYGLI